MKNNNMRFNHARKWMMVSLLLISLAVMGFSLYNVELFQTTGVVTSIPASLFVLFAPVITCVVLCAMLMVEYSKAGSDI